MIDYCDYCVANVEINSSLLRQEFIVGGRIDKHLKIYLKEYIAYTFMGGRSSLKSMVIVVMMMSLFRPEPDSHQMALIQLLPQFRC